MRKPSLLGLEKSAIAGIKDYYETTMADTNVFMGVADRQCVFNLAVRGLREHKVVGTETIKKGDKTFLCYEVEKHNYLMNAGLEQAIGFVQEWEMNDALLDMYAKKNLSKELLADLGSRRKLGLTIYGIPEGIPVFGHEPQISVHGTFERAQFPESLLVGVVGFQTAVATYASYVRNIVKSHGREILLLEGGSRRVYPGSAVAASRGALVGGFSGTSNEQFGIEYPELFMRVGGSSGHSSVLHAGSDEVAFETQVRAYYAINDDDSDEAIRRKVRGLEERGVGPTLLLDTIDSDKGLVTAIKMFKKYRITKGQVRNDSGDPEERSFYIRKELDAAGLKDTRIMISDDLTPDLVNTLLDNGAPMDTILMGTYLVNPFKLPGSVYKIAHDEKWGYVCKVSANNPAKATLPGMLDVYRIIGKEGYADKDAVLMRGVDDISDFVRVGEQAELLTRKIVDKGVQVYDFPSMDEIMQTREKYLGMMKEEHLRFRGAEEYPVVISDTVQNAKSEFADRFLMK